MAWIQDTYSKTLGHGGLDAIGIQQTFFKFFPRWKSQKIKSKGQTIDFLQILNPYPSLWIFLLEITKIWQKSRDFRFSDFFLEIFKIHRLVWILFFLVVLNLFRRCFFKVIANFKFVNTVLSITTFGSIFVSQDGALCAKEIHRLGPMDLEICTLAKKPSTVTGQLIKSINFRTKLSL